MTSTSTKEKKLNNSERRHCRIPFVEMVTLITPQGKSYVLLSDNLSLNGVFLIRPDPLPPGTEGLLNMTLKIGETKKGISSKFRVVHNGASQLGFPGMGIEFIEMSDADKAILNEALEHKDNS